MSRVPNLESKGREEDNEIQEPGVMLVCVDGSRYSSKALDVAIRLSQSDKRYQLIALHVSDPKKPHLPPHFSPDFLEFQLQRKLVNANRKSARVRIIPRLDHKITDVISRVAEEEKATMLVMGEFGRKGPSVWGQGSNTDWTMRRLPQNPVIVKTRSDAMADDKRCYRYLACVDGSESRSTSVVTSAAQFVRPSKDKLLVLHIRHPANVHHSGAKFGQLHRANSGKKTFVRADFRTAKAKGVDFEIDLSAESKENYGRVLESLGIVPEIIEQPQRHGMGVAQHICSAAEELEADVMVIGMNGMTAQASGKSVAAGSTADAVVKKTRVTVVVVKDAK